MSTQNIIIAVVVLAAIGGAGWWIMSDPVGDAARTAVDEATGEPVDRMDTDRGDEDLPSGMGRLLELYEHGVPMECRYTFEDADGTGEGTGFFDGDQMRISAQYQENGSVLVSNIINDGEMMYIWGDSPEGQFAIQMEASEEDMMDMEEEIDEAVAMNQEVEYDCHQWTVDPSVFNPPSDVQFMDMTQMMEGMMQGMPNMEGMDPEALEMFDEMMQGMPQR